MAKKPSKKGALTGVSKKVRRKAAKQEVKQKGRYQKDPGMPKGSYIRTGTGKKVQRRKPPKSMK